MLERLEALGRRWPWLGTILAVQKRFGEVHGGYLASAITLAAFLSMFPLLLVLLAVVGFFSSNSPDLSAEVIDMLGLTKSEDAVRLMTAAIENAEESRRAATVIGLAGLLWSGLGLVASLRYAYDSVWQVQDRGLKERLFGLLWLIGGGALFVASFAVTTLIGFLPGFLAPLNLLVGLAVGFTLFLWSGLVLCNRDVSWRALAPGAVVAAVGFEALKVLGGIYVPRAVASSSALYGSIGVVFAVLAWLFVFGRLLVYSSVLNVVLWERDHGTVSVEMEVPNLPGEVPLTGSRAGAAVPRDAVS